MGTTCRAPHGEPERGVLPWKDRGVRGVPYIIIRLDRMIQKSGLRPSEDRGQVRQ